MACIESALSNTHLITETEPGMGLQEPVIDADKLSNAIFSILESNFLFGYDAHSHRKPRETVVVDSSTPPQINGDDSSIQRGKISILSIDAAGMRGIIPGKALSYLEDALRRNSGNPQARIADYFDVVAGTSIGGIFAAILLSPNAGNADETWRFLVTEGEKIYCSANKPNSKPGFLKSAFKKSGIGGSTSSATYLQKALQKAFTDGKTSRGLTLKDTLKPVLIPCYDLSTASPFLFSRADALESESYNFNLWEVCLATSAEPGIFGPVTMKSVDGQTGCLGIAGGITMGNPTAAAITHVLHNKKDFPSVRGVQDICVLSLGCGGQLSENSFDHDQVKKWKPKDWARPLARISSDGSAELVDQAVAMAFAHCGHTNNYVRIQANKSSSGKYRVDSDSDPSPKNVKMLMEMGDEMLKEKNVESVLLRGRRIGENNNGEKLDRFAQELVFEHRRRTNT